MYYQQQAYLLKYSIIMGPRALHHPSKSSIYLNILQKLNEYVWTDERVYNIYMGMDLTDVTVKRIATFI